MKNFSKNSIAIVTSLVISCALGLTGPILALAASPAPVNLGSAGNFVILSKTGISTTGATSVVGDIGLSPAAATYITGFALILPFASPFSTSALITGKVYASDYANPTPANLTTAVLNMQTAYTDAAGRAPTVTELGAGNIGGLTLAPGVYKWGTGLTIPTNVTLSGGANDIWIFQIAQTLTVSSGVKVILSGGAQPSNIFWVVAGQTTIGTTAVFNGNILDQTAIVLNTGAKLNGRALAQTAVTLDSNAVTAPTSVVSTPSTPVVPTTPAISSSGSGTNTSASPAIPATPAVPTIPNSSSSYGGGYNLSYSPTVSTQSTPAGWSPTAWAQQQVDMAKYFSNVPFNGTIITPSASDSTFGQGVRMIAMSLAKGSSNNDVKILQQFLISQNKGSAAQALANVGATAYFGVLTRAALAEFQTNVGISPALGNFGSITRAYIQAHY